MNKAVIVIEITGDARPSEIVSDLRNATEILYHPKRVVGFWDRDQDIHLCPSEERGEVCHHKLPEGHADMIDYSLTMQRERQANLQVQFPHAGVSMYLR